MTVKKIAHVCTTRRHCEKDLYYEKDFISYAEM